MKNQSGKQASAEQLYFVGILPPPAIQQEVTAFKQQALDRFRTGHALNSPPHITLLPPFGSHRTDFSALTEFVADKKAIDIQLNGFDKFDQKVIFVDIMPNESLLALQKELELFAHYHLGIVPDYGPFRPHMTIAFKDLKRPIFAEAFAYFSGQPYGRTFAANTISLLKYMGKKWEVLNEWTLL